MVVVKPNQILINQTTAQIQQRPLVCAVLNYFKRPRHRVLLRLCRAVIRFSQIFVHRLTYIPITTNKRPINKINNQ